MRLPFRKPNPGRALALAEQQLVAAHTAYVAAMDAAEQEMKRHQDAMQALADRIVHHSGAHDAASGVEEAARAKAGLLAEHVTTT